MLRYDDFKNLTGEQKEEWIYRFHNKLDVKSLEYMGVIIVFFMLMYSTMFLAYLIGTADALVDFRLQVAEILSLSMDFLQLGIVLLLIFSIWDLGKILFYVYGVHKFKKRCGIKPRNLRWFFRRIEYRLRIYFTRKKGGY